MPLPPEMKAVEITSPGDPDVLKLATRPVPMIGEDEILVKVAAAGVNRPDVIQRQGRYDPPAGVRDSPGHEIAGRVAGVGGKAGGGTVGAPVCALVAGGGYAQDCAAAAGQCLPLPEGFSVVEAAAVPETCFTVW